MGNNYEDSTLAHHTKSQHPMDTDLGIPDKSRWHTDLPLSRPLLSEVYGSLQLLPHPLKPGRGGVETTLLLHVAGYRYPVADVATDRMDKAKVVEGVLPHGNEIVRTDTYGNAQCLHKVRIVTFVRNITAP